MYYLANEEEKNSMKNCCIVLCKMMKLIIEIHT